MLVDIHGWEGAMDVLLKVINELSNKDLGRKSWYGIVCYAEMIKYVQEEFNTKGQ